MKYSWRTVTIPHRLPQWPVTRLQPRRLLKSSWKTVTILHRLSWRPVTLPQSQRPLKSLWRIVTIPHRLLWRAITRPQPQRLLKSSWRTLTIPRRLPRRPVTRRQPQRTLKSFGRTRADTAPCGQAGQECYGPFSAEEEPNWTPEACVPSSRWAPGDHWPGLGIWPCAIQKSPRFKEAPGEKAHFGHAPRGVALPSPNRGGIEAP